MEKDNGQGKWAGEVYDVLRLFRQINNTIYGLLLVEIGWVFLLILVTKLALPAGKEGAPAVITAPWLGWRAVPVVDLFLPGALFLAALWAVWSNLIGYIWMPLRNILRHGGILVSLLLMLANTLVNVLLLPMTIPQERKRARRWLSQVGEEGQLRLRKELGDPEAARLRELIEKKAWSTIDLEFGWKISNLAAKQENQNGQQQTELRRLLEERVLYQAALKGTRFDRWYISDWLNRPLIPAIRWLGSRTYIGFAPLRSFSYTEDINAAKAPTQVFPAASDRLRWQLRNIKLLRHISFDYLPEHRVPANSAEASFLRRFLGLDVLIWGSFLPGNTRQIWLNIEQPLSRQELNEVEEETNQHRERKEQQELFPWELKTRYSAIVINQEEALDTYVVLLVSLLQTLKVRQDLKSSPLAKLFGGRLGDKLEYSRLEFMGILEHVVFEAFPAISAPPSAANGPYPVPQRIIIEMVGQWVGYQIGEAASELRSRSLTDEYKAALKQITKRCIELEPSIPENYYRFGVLACLLNQPEAALQAFMEAKKYEVVRHAEASNWLMAYAKTTLGMNRFTEELNLALFVGYAARAINLGSDWTKKSLKQDLEKSSIFSLHQWYQRQNQPNQEEASEITFWTVVDELLSDFYQPGPVEA